LERVVVVSVGERPGARVLDAAVKGEDQSCSASEYVGGEPEDWRRKYVVPEEMSVGMLCRRRTVVPRAREGTGSVHVGQRGCDLLLHIVHYGCVAGP
jgi:hypothetical protein